MGEAKRRREVYRVKARTCGYHLARCQALRLVLGEWPREWMRCRVEAAGSVGLPTLLAEFVAGEQAYQAGVACTCHECLPSGGAGMVAAAVAAAVRLPATGDPAAPKEPGEGGS